MKSLRSAARVLKPLSPHYGRANASKNNAVRLTPQVPRDEAELRTANCELTATFTILIEKWMDGTCSRAARPG